MWGKDSRDSIWSTIEHAWDVIVVGGGACGAGVFNYAARAGLRALLVEANDFAFGASGRSGKQVHGFVLQPGSGQWIEEPELGRERQKLLNEAPFLFQAMELRQGEAGSKRGEPTGGRGYPCASVDDARLVLRLIREGVGYGGVALNYTRAVQLLFNLRGEVCGVVLRDRAQGEDGRTAEVQARAVISAAGAWCDELRAKAGAKTRLKQKIGSHLFVSAERLPLAGCRMAMHPRDSRPLFFTPWEGAVIVGATELDYFLPEDVAEPAISTQEIEYLLEGMALTFPGQELGVRDVIACHAGVQSLGDDAAGRLGGAASAGILTDENGLISVTTGRLGTFRLAAARALNALRRRLPGLRPFDADRPIFEPVGEMPYSTTLDPAGWTYLAGRYGRELPGLLASTPSEELQPIYPQLPAMWAELRWAARDGAVIHLDDLLLRRLRLGLLVKRGGLTELEDLRPFIQPELGWDNIRWQWEVMRYSRIHELYYSV